MTFRQAFTEWAAIPQNTALAARHRNATNAVLLKAHGNDDVRQFTAFYTRKLMQDCKLPQPMKAQAASILVHALKYAAEKKACVRPDFDFSIAGERLTAEATPSAAPPEASEVPGQEAPKAQVPKPPLKERKKHSGGRNAINVTQLSLKTLKPLRTFKSAKQACVAVGLQSMSSVSKAIKSRRAAGGFFWCKTGEENSFIPDEKRPYNIKGRMTINKNIAPAKPEGESCRGTEALGSQERERGSATPRAENGAPSARTPLSSFSDEELKNELISRGWKGTLYKHLIF